MKLNYGEKGRLSTGGKPLSKWGVYLSVRDVAVRNHVWLEWGP